MNETESDTLRLALAVEALTVELRQRNILLAQQPVANEQAEGQDTTEFPQSAGRVSRLDFFDEAQAREAEKYAQRTANLVQQYRRPRMTGEV